MTGQWPWSRERGRGQGVAPLASRASGARLLVVTRDRGGLGAAAVTRARLGEPMPEDCLRQQASGGVCLSVLRAETGPGLAGLGDRTGPILPRALPVEVRGIPPPTHPHHPSGSTLVLRHERRAARCCYSHSNCAPAHSSCPRKPLADSCTPPQWLTTASGKYFAWLTLRCCSRKPYRRDRIYSSLRIIKVSLGRDGA